MKTSEFNGDYVRGVVKWFALAHVLTSAVAMGLAVFSGWIWPYELLTHFWVLYMLSFVVTSLLLFFAQSYRWLVCSLCLLVLSTLPLQPFLSLPPVPIEPFLGYYDLKSLSEPSGAEHLRVMHLNLYQENRNTDAVTQAIRAYQPDVLSLQELNQRWVDDLAPVLADYPYQVVRPLDTNFGLGLFSRYPLQSIRVVNSGRKEPLTLSASLSTNALMDFTSESAERGHLFPMISAELSDLPAQMGRSLPHLRVVVAHPMPPIGERFLELRNRQFRDMAALVNMDSSTPLMASLLIGDFNCSPWSPYFQKLLDESRMHNSMGPGDLTPTWHATSLADFPFSLLGLPIDHLLYRGSLKVLRRHVGESVGSDHRPVYIELGLSADVLR